MIQLFFREDALLKDDLADGLARRICLACELGGLLIADVRQECGHDADTVVEPLLALLDVRLQIDEELVDEGVDRARDVVQRVEHIERHDRLHDVQLELTVLHGERHSEVACDNLIARLIEHLGDDGVDLARHDRRARLTHRQMQLVQAAARSRCHEAEVVREFDEDECRILERGGEIGERVRVVRRIDDILRRTVLLARDLREPFGDRLDIGGLSVQSRTDSGAAHVDRVDVPLNVADAAHGAAHGGRVRAHLLSQRDGDSVLQMGTSHLEDGAERGRLFLKLRGETVERCEEYRALYREADLDARRERVVRRLRHIRVIVRRDDVVASLRIAAQLEGAVAEHLVHVHVDGCARTALNRVDRELLNVPARDDLVCRLHEHVADFVRETACIHVRKSRRLFHRGKCFDKIGIELLSRDVEILDGTHRLHAVVNIIGDFQFTEKIVFRSHDALSFR